MGIVRPLQYAVFIALTATGADAAPKINKAARAYLALTPADVRSLVQIQDDGLDTVATLDTQPVFLEKKGLLGIVWNDNFVRAYVDKKTGKAIFQLYQMVAYNGPWRFYYQVNFETPTGPEAAQLTVIDRHVGSCAASAFSGGCSLSEDFAFEVPEDLLRAVAQTYVPGEVKGWRFKFKAKAAQDWPDGISAAEIGGLLLAVDDYRVAHNLSRSSGEKVPVK